MISGTLVLRRWQYDNAVMNRNRAPKVTEPTLETNSNPHRFKRIPVQVLTESLSVILSEPQSSFFYFFLCMLFEL